MDLNRGKNVKSIKPGGGPVFQSLRCRAKMRPICSQIEIYAQKYEIYAQKYEIYAQIYEIYAQNL